MNKKIENLSINEIFKSRKEFIPEIGEQLRDKKEVEIKIGKDEKVKIDYREISIMEKENKEADAVLLLPGFGSGWEGISELGFSLACEGRRVIMPSLPGYGNSENPSKKYYDTDNFENEADAVNSFLEQVDLKDKKVHLIGHSMGSEILASLAKKYSDKISSLVLLNPAGIKEKENAIKLSSKFILSGMQTSIDFNVKTFFSGDREYQNELKKYIPKTRSPFEKNRISQRLAETRKVSNGNLLKKIKKIEVPITYISGELDTVYPPGNESDENSQLTQIIKNVRNKSQLETSVMIGLRHNTTIAPDEITATNIEHYLEVAETKK